MKAAVIIAGGRSTRFGDEDKAVATLAGRPMIGRVADRVARCVDALVINCRAEQTGPIRRALAEPPVPVSFALDETPDLGPVAGMAQGLRDVADRHEDATAVVVACDMPFVDPSIVDYLFEQSSGVDAVVPRLADGWYQPTHAVYDPERMAAACERAIDEDRLRIMDPLEELEMRTVEEDELAAVGDLASFENINTQDELRAAADRLRQEPDDRPGESR